MNAGGLTDFDFSDDSIFGQDASTHWPTIKAEGIYLIVTSSGLTYGTSTPASLSYADCFTGWGAMAGGNLINDGLFAKNHSGVWQSMPQRIQVTNIKSSDLPSSEFLRLTQTSGATINTMASLFIAQLNPAASGVF